MPGHARPHSAGAQIGVSKPNLPIAGESIFALIVGKMLFADSGVRLDMHTTRNHGPLTSGRVHGP